MEGVEGEWEEGAGGGEKGVPVQGLETEGLVYSIVDAAVVKRVTLRVWGRLKAMGGKGRTGGGPSQWEANQTVAGYGVYCVLGVGVSMLRDHN